MGNRKFYFGIRSLGAVQKLTRRCLLVALGIGLFASVPSLKAEKLSHQRAVASEHPLVTREAMAQLRAGGNAVDAAVTAAFVAGVVNPTASGIGGGGFVMYWDAERQQASVIDFRETAPRAVDAPAFERRPFAANDRGKGVGVPGEVAGLFTLHQRYGKRTWQQVIEPAIRAAEKGFRIEPHLARAIEGQVPALRSDAWLSEFLFPGGQKAAVGTRRKNPALANTLRSISALGPWGFYEGPVANDIASTVQAAGGAVTLDDLQSYRALDRAPLVAHWEGYDVYTMPAPSAGGLMMAETLGQLSRAELLALGRDSGAYYHLLAEVLRGAVADRLRYVSDPAFASKDFDALLAPARLKVRRASIRMDQAQALPSFGLEEHGTHHMVAADASGDMVSLTTTVNHSFGAKLMTRTGIVLNDQLDDFSKQDDVRQFGLSESPNRPRPGARPVSSMTPTIVVQNHEAVLALGGSGGPKIATNVTQALLQRLVFGLAPAAIVKQPRLSIPSKGATLWAEDSFDPALIADLKARGETMDPAVYKDTSGVQMVAKDGARFFAASDPRKFGFALVE